MTEQKYRAVVRTADGQQLHGTLTDIQSAREEITATFTEDRVEHPVPTPDEPMWFDRFGPNGGQWVGTPNAEQRALAASAPAPHPPTREQINSAVGSVLFNASNYPRPAMPHILGEDIGPLRNKLTDAVLALIQNGADRD